MALEDDGVVQADVDDLLGLVDPVGRRVDVEVVPSAVLECSKGG